jgi:hypothetical protein
MYKFFSSKEIDGSFQIGNVKQALNIFITPWTIAHFIFGYVFYLLGFNYFYGFIIHSLYEYVTFTNKKVQEKWKHVYDGFKKDSFFNTIGDTVFFMLAMFLAKKYNNVYFLLIIILIGIWFFSPTYQNYLLIERMNYWENKYPELKNRPNKDYNNQNYFFWYIWILVSIITIIKLKLKKQI